MSQDDKKLETDDKKLETDDATEDVEASGDTPPLAEAGESETAAEGDEGGG